MRRLVALFLLSLGACANTLGPSALSNIPLDVDPSIALFTPDGGGGHACPVAGAVVTAKHVMWDEENKTYLMASWSAQNGAEGGAGVAGESWIKDLVRLTLVGGEVSYLATGATPVAGDRVHWFEYDFRTTANAYRSRRRVAEVLRVVAGHIIFNAAPVPGASGTCLVNTNGEVVGIVIAYTELDNGRSVGVAAGLSQEMLAP